MNPPMIEFQHVSKKYPGSERGNTGGGAALRDVSFVVERGELVFLAGPSGAGKSTLLKMIAAIERPSSGRVFVNGQDIGQIKAAGLPLLRRNLGLILQQVRLLNDRNVLANVTLPLIVAGAPQREAQARATAALEKVGLEDKALHHPQALSGGEQQRVAIARAIVNRPQIILADEPTANLDRISAKRVLDALTAFQAAGVTCLISTHDEPILKQAGRVIRLEQGQLTTEQVTAPPESDAKESGHE
jgi:cell division transport system ATP-binding protein